MRARLVAGIVGLGLLAAACGGDDGGTSSGAASTDRADSAAESTGTTVDQVAASPAEDVPSALDDPNDESFPEPLVDPGDLLSGGPPPDGIPAIDEPKFLSPDRADFLEDNEPMMALEIGDDARAYPMQIMTWHEIVNDTVDGVPVAVTYCPLCNTAIAYDRRLGDRVLDFGTSGMLYNSALVMYDRQTESLWSHFTAQAIVGHLAGEELDVYPVAIVSWADWREAHPDGLVLSRDTGHDRDYGRNPYPGYDDIDSPAFLFDGEVDDRLAAKERVVGIERDGDAVAVRLDELADRGVIAVEVGATELVVWLEPGTASALDSGSVAAGKDVGASGVFVPVADGRTLSFQRSDDGFVDDQTGSRWNVLGQAVDGPLGGASLEPIVHVDTFWFAWGSFLPDTRIVP
ncbi:MAG TPA: DUF3179 domain-containing protein [Acidimicrobiales bacterium]|nr:DUF3179 domain-containing protein [Acidimicrobiales bacterium]